MASRSIGDVVLLESGESVRGVELSGEDHPGHDPFAAPVSSVFVQFADRDGRVVRMARCGDENAVLRLLGLFSERAHEIGGS